MTGDGYMRIGTGLRALAGAAMLLALGACVGLGGPKPPPVLFNLTPVQVVAVGTSTTGKPADAILVLEPETDRRLAAQRVPVQVADGQVAYLADAMWVERPARLFRALVAETLRAKSGRLVFEGEVPGAGVRLAGRLSEMGYDARSQSVVVRYDALRTTSKGDVTARRFESVVPGVSATAAAVGPALNRAANDVAGQVAEWME
jgi:cholesterol transport system auxiliary component